MPAWHSAVWWHSVPIPPISPQSRVSSPMRPRSTSSKRSMKAKTPSIPTKIGPAGRWSRPIPRERPLAAASVGYMKISSRSIHPAARVARHETVGGYAAHHACGRLAETGRASTDAPGGADALRAGAGAGVRGEPGLAPMGLVPECADEIRPADLRAGQHGGRRDHDRRLLAGARAARIRDRLQHVLRRLLA